MKLKTGILLINLGTPNSPSKSDVRNYLRELLSCERVLDINPITRWILLNFFILPFRPIKTAKAYKKIWTDEGSPFLVYSKKLENDLATQFLKEEIHVELGMQCGEPKLKNAIKNLQKNKCDRIIVVPLYPQYASSSFGSAVEDVLKEVMCNWNIPFLQIIPPFFSDPLFIEAWANVGLNYIQKNLDYILFSFHGLPIRHLKKSDYSGKWCKNNQSCCEKLVQENRYCYSAQCYLTAKLIAKKLNIKENRWSVSFQSRLGRDRWIQPYTEQKIKDLAESGFKKIAVFCPSFVSDCLETTEEIGISAADHFKKHGGEDLYLVPSLNNNPKWVKALASIIRRQFYP